MDIVSIITPPIAGYLTTLQCDGKLNKKSSNQSTNYSTTNYSTNPSNLSREFIWPVLLSFVGFAWYFSRISNQNNDVQFAALTVSMCVWLWLSTCKHHMNFTAFVMLLLNIYLIYNILTTSDMGISMAMLTPVILWIFFMVEFSLKDLRLPSLKDIIPYRIVRI